MHLDGCLPHLRFDLFLGSVDLANKTVHFPIRPPTMNQVAGYQQEATQSEGGKAASFDQRGVHVIKRTNEQYLDRDDQGGEQKEENAGSARVLHNAGRLLAVAFLEEQDRLFVPGVDSDQFTQDVLRLVKFPDIVKRGGLFK